MTQSSCLCGKNSISFSGPPILTFRCHCTDERKLTGAAFALNILMSSENLKVISGDLSTWSKRADNGNTITNHSCGQCGGLLYRTTSGHPGTMVIKAGCIDGVDAAKEFVPSVEIFTRSRVPWIPAIEGTKQCEGDFE
ncbi:Mss4-like protein [Halenospora varia]|nr:Mss4-like protein [Halenospora varia]